MIKEYSGISLAVCNDKYDNISKFTNVVCKDKSNYTPRISGDEMLLIMKCNKEKVKTVGGDEILEIISIARELKLRWLVSDTNEKRLREKKRPIDLAIGANIYDGNRNYSYEGAALKLPRGR
ncbi:MAG: hypothetical protein L7F77_12695 [Candidatus Magnetominusculus sp. LBB02]|nr:hypothetical protein [Candidatus Magnetominusculus sp. LBB02]